MRTTLGALGPITLAPIVIPIIEDVEKKTRSKGWLGKFLTDVADPANAFPDIKAVASAILHTGDVPTGPQNAAGGAAVEAAAKAAAGRARIQAAANAGAPPPPRRRRRPKNREPPPRPSGTRLRQRRASRLLMRGGLGDLQQQLTALKQADVLLKARLAKTTDITRRQKLEDELFQNAAQERGIRQQMLANTLQAQQQAAAKRQAQAQKIHDKHPGLPATAMSASGPTGQPKVPDRENGWKQELAQVTAQVGDNAQLQKVGVRRWRRACCRRAAGGAVGGAGHHRHHPVGVPAGRVSDPLSGTSRPRRWCRGSA